MKRKVLLETLKEGDKFKLNNTTYEVVKEAGLDGYYEGLYKLFTTRKNVVLAVEAKRKYKYDIYHFEMNEEVEPI